MGGRVTRADAEAHQAAGQLASPARRLAEWPMSATKVQKEPLRARLLEELGITTTIKGDRR